MDLKEIEFKQVLNSAWLYRQIEIPNKKNALNKSYYFTYQQLLVNTFSIFST